MICCGTPCLINNLAETNKMSVHAENSLKLSNVMSMLQCSASSGFLYASLEPDYKKWYSANRPVLEVSKLVFALREIACLKMEPIISSEDLLKG